MYHIQARARKNSTKFSKTIVNCPEIEHVLDYLKEYKLEVLERPYIFTHLRLSDGTIITQTTEIGKDKASVLVSPEKLAKTLKV